MAWPFTSISTFLSNLTPKLTAAFLNSLQGGVAAAAYPAYARIKYVAYSDNQTSITIPLIEPYTALDAGTSQYVGMPAATSVTVSSGFTNSSWQYVYVKVTNSVAAYSVSTTAPEATLRYQSGNENSRYICAVYVNGSAQIRRFDARDGRYTYLEKIYFALPGGTPSDSTGVTMSTSWTAINYPSGAFPATASFSRIYVNQYDQSFCIAQFRSATGNQTNNGSTGARSLIIQGSATTSTLITNSGVFEFYGTSSFYAITSANTTGYRIVLDGFSE